jgi:MoxR-like ATPase
LRGHYIPNGNTFVWHDGPAIAAWRKGCRLVLDEIDRASGDAFTFLLALLDDPESARLTLPTGETVRPTAGFSCVATSNQLDLESAMPAALLDRFARRIHIDELSEGALQKLPAELRGIASQTIKESGDRYISYRQWLAYAEDAHTVGADIAAKTVFGARWADVRDAIKLAADKRS